VRKLIVAGIALACATAAIAADDGADPVHDVIQQFLYDVRGGVDFGQPQFAELIAADDVAKLKAFKECQLEGVTRTERDVLAIVHFKCGEAAGTGSVMLSFEQGMIAEIDVVSYVQVGAS
jgi:hypothetical protein